MWTDWTEMDQNGLNRTKVDQRGQNRPSRTFEYFIFRAYISNF